MYFRDIPGQSQIKNELRNIVLNDSLPNSILLNGKTGYGSLGLALAFAHYIQCTNRTEEDSCGECDHCLRNQRLEHPDVYFSFPTVGKDVISDMMISKWRNAVLDNFVLNIQSWQSLLETKTMPNINKKECSKIYERLSLKSSISNKKIQIIWYSEFLGLQGNKLLKIIEEPPENTHFILISDDSKLILGTILSRSRIFNLPPLKDEDIHTYLINIGISTDKAERLAFMSSGDLNLALKSINTEINEYSDLFVNFFRLSYAYKGIELAKWIDDFSKKGKDNLLGFFSYGLKLINEILHYKITHNLDSIKLSSEEKTHLINLSKVMTIEQIEKIIHLFEKTSYNIKRNILPKILFLDLGIELNKILRRK